MSFVFGVVVTLALGLAPPVWIAGMPMWFYLAPGLMLAYFAPVRLILVTGLGVFAAVYLVAAPERGASTQLGLISLALVVGVAFLRASAFTRETISLAIGLLLVGAIPAALLMYLYVFGFEFSHAAFLVSRYAVQSLLAILAAELGVIIVVMSRSPVLAGLRQAFSYRPSLVQLFETVVATGLLASLTLTLILSWQSWEAQIESDMRNRAFARLEYLHNAILGSVEDRLRLAQVNLATMAVLKTTSADTIATSIRDQLCVACAVAAGVRGVDVAVSSGSAFGVTDGWSRNDAQRALEQLTEALQFNDDVAAFQWQSGSGAVYPVTGTRNAAGAAVMLRFTDSARAVDFEFSPFMNRQIQDDAVQLSRLSISEVMRRGAEPVLPDTAVVTRQFPDGLIWAEKDSLSVSPQQIMVTNLPASAQASFALPLGRVERYSSQLHGAGHYQARLAVWPYVADFARTVSLNTVALLAELVGLLILSRLVLSRLVAPLSELTRIFESWRQFRGGELGSGAALQAMDASPVSPLEDIHRLQLGFRALAQDVMYGERRLGTIAANYDELLRSLPLGVLAVDGSARVQFLNDALGNMTGQRQEVLQRLQAHAAQMLGSGRTVDEWQLLLDNEPPKSLLLVVNHRLDERGQESGLWVIVTDLTEQKQTSAQLIQASKLATLGEMSTGMAHELNQPLNVISLATSNLRFAIKKGKASSENTFSKLDRIDGAVHRAASIIDHMRAFGRLAGEGLTDINLGEVVAGACNLLGEQLKLANIALLNKVPEEGLSVKGNAIQLEQVLINLVSNSKDAIRETGSSGSITIDADVSAGRVRLRVTDSGGGIPEHALPHIFEPFFTTKPVGKGTGLGGSISYGIVREMQGDIWAENVTDGAQITISLPLSDGDESHRSLADELA